MQKTYLYLMVCVIGAMSLASCSEDSISPDAGGDGDGDSTTEVPLAQVAKPKPNPWLAQEEYSITHFNSAQTDAFSSAVKDGTFNIDLSKCQMTLKSATKLFSVLLASKRPLITELADKLRLKYPLLPTISPCPTMRLEAIRSIIPISCRRYPKSV